LNLAVKSEESSEKKGSIVKTSRESSEKKPNKKARLSLPVLPIHTMDASDNPSKSPRTNKAQKKDENNNNNNNDNTSGNTNKNNENNEKQELKSKKSGKFQISLPSPTETALKQTPRGSKTARDSISEPKTPRDSKGTRESIVSPKTPRDSTATSRFIHESSGESNIKKSSDSGEKTSEATSKKTRATQSGNEKVRIPRGGKKRADVKKQTRSKKRKTNKDEILENSLQNPEDSETKIDLADTRESLSVESRESPTKEPRKSKPLLGGLLNLFSKSSRSTTHHSQNPPVIVQPLQQQQSNNHSSQLILGVANAMKSQPVEHDLELQILKSRVNGHVLEREKVSPQLLSSVATALLNNKEELDRLWQSILKANFFDS